MNSDFVGNNIVVIDENIELVQIAIMLIRQWGLIGYLIVHTMTFIISIFVAVSKMPTIQDVNFVKIPTLPKYMTYSI